MGELATSQAILDPAASAQQAGLKLMWSTSMQIQRHVPRGFSLLVNNINIPGDLTHSPLYSKLYADALATAAAGGSDVKYAAQYGTWTNISAGSIGDPTWDGSLRIKTNMDWTDTGRSYGAAAGSYDEHVVFLMVAVDKAPAVCGSTPAPTGLAGNGHTCSSPLCTHPPFGYSEPTPVNRSLSVSPELLPCVPTRPPPPRCYASHSPPCRNLSSCSTDYLSFGDAVRALGRGLGNTWTVGWGWTCSL